MYNSIYYADQHNAGAHKVNVAVGGLAQDGHDQPALSKAMLSSNGRKMARDVVGCRENWRVLEIKEA
jgi:hypothetical protein